MKPYNIALLGCGTVGSGVARLLLEQADRLAARAGRRLVLKAICVKHPHKERSLPLPPGMVTNDLHTIINDPDIHVAVEVVGGTTWARHAMLELLAAGKRRLFLTTDIANPTSNAIYARIGFVPETDEVHLDFVAAAS